MGAKAREFWDIVGLALASGVLMFLVVGLLISMRNPPLVRSRGAQIVLDCVVILGCMWAVWYVGRWM